jgi:hypothetical protein
LFGGLDEHLHESIALPGIVMGDGPPGFHQCKTSRSRLGQMAKKLLGVAPFERGESPP